MNMLLNLESPVTTAHRAKLAYIYVRQSTAGQVRQHQESTELQYRLVDRAAAFGWPKERIEVIDDDLGKSGTSSDGRGGFQRLIAEIGLGKAGLVLSLDASRLARNNHDWHQLLELCSLFGVLIADGERVYDPCAYHDRLLLGLNGNVEFCRREPGHGHRQPVGVFAGLLDVVRGIGERRAVNAGRRIDQTGETIKANRRTEQRREIETIHDHILL